MPERARSWIMPLSDVDRIAIRLVTDGHDVLQFSVQYEALIAGHWRKLTRYDNAHGSGPHRHVYYPGKSYRQSCTFQTTTMDLPKPKWC